MAFIFMFSREPTYLSRAANSVYTIEGDLTIVFCRQIIEQFVNSVTSVIRIKTIVFCQLFINGISIGSIQLRTQCTKEISGLRVLEIKANTYLYWNLCTYIESYFIVTLFNIKLCLEAQRR